ncbi:unnamed protein product [Allacma fusca]|uniref:4-coumarate--CoA ligase n=1 Tax=Allacma fusca TaxID=39272 RepID=A0A8J2NM78_9HEXA|nr:unnamed protein product [Allacma fusca]
MTQSLSVVLRPTSNSLRVLPRSNVLKFSTSANYYNEKNVIRSKQPSISIPEDVTVPEFLHSQVGNWGNQVAYECSATGLKFTHNEVIKYSRSFGAALIKSGIKTGDIAIILLPNCPQFPVALQGMLLTGIIASPISPSLTPAEITAMVAQTKAKAIVTIPEFLPLVKALQGNPAGASIAQVISFGKSEGVHDFFTMIQADATGMEFLQGSKIDTKTEPATILWSSGTTGLPKGVISSHKNYIAQLLQLTQDGVSLSTRGSEIALGLIPFFHILGTVLSNASIHLGMKIVTVPKFDPKLFTKVFKENKFTITHLVPPLLKFLVANPAITKEDFERMNTIVCGAAAVPPHVVHSVWKKAGKEIYFGEGFGLTETTGGTHKLTPSSNNTRIGSIGRLLASTEAKIVDVETGETLGPNQNGEIFVRGPQVMQGYLDNDEATRNTIDKDGWLRSGDIGYYAEDGHFYIVDRLKELIKVKGLQVAPSELEAVLSSFAKVADVAVIGVPDERAGELPRAYVVRKDPSVTAEEINEYVLDKLAEHKHLKGGIEFVDAIPKSPAGKILRKDLRALYNKL